MSVPDNFTWNYYQRPEFYFASKKNWPAITRDHTYEDEGESFNEVNNDAPQTWELHYAPIDRDTVGANFCEHYDNFRQARAFNFIAKDGNTYSVRYASFDFESVEPKKSQTQRYKIVLKKVL